MTVFDLPGNHNPRRARRDVEGPIHRAVLQYLRLVLRGAVIHHSPNEVDLSGAAVARAIAKAKSKGMLTGFPDILVIWAGQVWAFEVKAPGNKPTAEQARVGADIVSQGGKWAVVRSVDEAAAYVAQWMETAPQVAVVEKRGSIS